MQSYISKIQITAILSTRRYLLDSFYDLIYEWEDDLSHYLKIPIYNSIPLLRKLVLNELTRKFLFGSNSQFLYLINNYIESNKYIRPSKGSFLVFELGMNVQPNFATSKRAIPVLIDLWKHANVEKLNYIYKDCPIVLISSLETYEYLKHKKCNLNLVHFPLSISSRYLPKVGVFYKKSICILLAGRVNSVLKSFLTKFIQKYPQTEYVEQQKIDNEFWYVSNTKGVLGQFKTRDEYISLLRSSKISFYSTPGIDGGEERTGGFNPVTPRYLELLSAQCLIVGRYPNNADTRFYELERVCSNVDNYEQFEVILKRYINVSVVPVALYEQILNRHITTRRAELLTKLLA